MTIKCKIVTNWLRDNGLFDYYMWCPFSEDLNEGRDVVDGASTGVLFQSRVDDGKKE